MEIKLAYGKQGISVTVPEKNLVKVLKMGDTKPVSDSYIELTKSLLRPIGFDHGLFDMAKTRKNACILICDKTRPVPNHLLLPPILKTLHAAGLSHEDITILIATGMHSPNLDDEIIQLVGKNIAENYSIENHYCHDKNAHHFFGKTDYGTPIFIDRRYSEADLKIGIGFIEPHFMAGFSGGRKLITPGIAGFDTMKVLHGPQMMAEPKSHEGSIDENPFHLEALKIAEMVGMDFLVNVALDENKNIIGIFSGDLKLSHEHGVEYVRSIVNDTVPEPVDIVITSGGGYPLDSTWYQTIKGVTSAFQILKENGTIIVASECSEGIGSPEFKELSEKTLDLKKFQKKVLTDSNVILDQWQLQKFANVATRANVILVSDKLKPARKNALHLNWENFIGTALAVALQNHGQDAKVAVIPSGPYILPSIA